MKKHLVAALVVCTGLGIAYFATRESNVRVGIRELKLPTIERQNITKIEYVGKETFALKKEGDGYLLEMAENGSTRLVPAGKELIKELFDALIGINGGGYISEQVAKHADFKVSDDKGQKVTLFAGDKPVWSLIIGDYADEGGRFVRVPSSDPVFLVKARFWDITRSSAADFRERKIIGLEDSAIAAVKLEKGDKHIIGFALDEKNNLGFDAKTLAMFGDIKLSPSKISEFVKTITGLRAASFVEAPDAIQEAQAFLDASSERIVVIPKSKGPDVVVKVANDEKAKKAYAQVLGSRAVFEISDYAYGRFHVKADEFAEVVGESEKAKAPSAGAPTDMKSLPPELQKQIQEAIRKQQGQS